MNYREVFCLKKLHFRAASTLLGAVFLLFSAPALTFAEEAQVKYTPFSIKTGGTGATTVEQAKENLEIPNVVQTAGTSETSVMSQKAVTDAIAAGSGGGIVVTQASGQSTTNVMSQKAVTDALDAVSQPTVVQNTGQSITSIMSQKAVTDALDAVSQPTVVQSTGTSIADVMSQKAVTDAINAVPQTTIVQTTGQAVNSVMSQKAVTDAILTAQNIFNMVWPVESIYLSMSSVNPGTIFGGTWEQIQDKFLLSAGTTHTVNSTGGNESIALSSSNIPGHTHSFSATTSNTGAHTHGFSATTSNDGSHTHGLARAPSGSAYRESIGYTNTSNRDQTTQTDWAGGHTHTISGTSGSSGDHAHTISGTTGSTGSGSAFNIMPPYLVVYIWKRTA